MNRRLIPDLFAATEETMTAAPPQAPPPSTPARPAPPPAEAIGHRYEPPEHVEPGATESAGSVSARIIAERFINEIQHLWSRSAPLVDNLWQPPGE